jgi:hypothetical protein
MRACVEILLRNGADVNQADGNGNTPLCRLFTAPCFRSYLGHLLEEVLWITPADIARIAPLLLQDGANPDDRMTPVNTGSHWDEQVSAAKWAVRRWPLSVMEHAFWNADYEACQRLLDAGMVLDQEAVLWMIRLVLEESQDIQQSATAAALEFIRGLPAEPRCAALRHPLCLALAFRREWLEIAQESWDLGPQLSQFSEKLQVDDLVYPAPAPPGKWVESGVLCLNWAAKWNAAAILEGLLQLGVRPIPPCALLHAVRN